LVAAPVVALVAFRAAFPSDARERMNTLIGVMVHELQAMGANPDAPNKRHIWRARHYHRLLGLVRWMEKAGDQPASAVDGCLAVLSIGNAILRMQELPRESDLKPATARSLEAALRRMRHVGREPERVVRALKLAAVRLSREARPEVHLVGDAAASLAANIGFFRVSSDEFPDR
jgi:hypothetical protein